FSLVGFGALSDRATGAVAVKTNQLNSLQAQHEGTRFPRRTDRLPRASWLSESGRRIVARANATSTRPVSSGSSSVACLARIEVGTYVFARGSSFSFRRGRLHGGMLDLLCNSRAKEMTSCHR